MSIKSTNIDFDTLPNPPIGYSYIGTDLDGVLSIKLDTGSVIRPGGVSYLNQLTDVNISGSTIGQALLWDGENWVNGDVASTFDDTNLWSSLSGETSERISTDQSLATSINNIPEFDDTDLWSSISGETSERISGDASLATSINNIPEFDDTNLWSSISGETSERISGDASLANSINNIPEFDDTDLWSSLSGETSERVSGDTLLWEAVNNIEEYDDTNIWTELSGETSERISADSSLASIIDNIEQYDDTNIWSELSGETSERISSDESLASAISNIPEYNDTNLWTELSGETSERISADASLASAISGGGGSSLWEADGVNNIKPLNDKLVDQSHIDNSIPYIKYKSDDSNEFSYIEHNGNNIGIFKSTLDTNVNSGLGIYKNNFSGISSVTISAGTNSTGRCMMRFEQNKYVEMLYGDGISGATLSRTSLLTKEQIEELIPELSYSGLSYNVVTGATITTTGTTTINFETTDLYIVDISGNTTTGITFDFSGGTIGKTLTMKITNSGSGNTTECVFSNNCLVFGNYIPSLTNAISVMCVSTTESVKYWVMIANA